LLQPIAAFEQVIVQVVPFFLEGELVVRACGKRRAEVDLHRVLGDAEGFGVVLPEIAHRDGATVRTGADQTAHDAALA